MKEIAFAARIAALALALAVFCLAAPPPALAGQAQLAQAAGDDKAELAFWDAIKDSKNPDEFKAYLDTYPKGKFTALARVRMDALQKQAQPAAQPAAAAASSTMPQLPGQSGGAAQPAAQPAAAAAAKAEPAKEEPKIEYWTAAKGRVNVYKEPNGRSSFVYDDYYVIEQSIKVVEIIPGKKQLPWLKVISPKNNTGYVFSGEARPAGVSASGKPVQSPNMDD
jgi:hypothetical protein